MLLSRVAENIFWAARYMQRAEATARTVRVYTEVQLDLPLGVHSSWAPLLALAGGPPAAASTEAEVVRFLVADRENHGSVVSSVVAARENFRTTREVVPREAWQVVNDLYQLVGRDAEAGVDRRYRPRFLAHVIAEYHRLVGVIHAALLRDEAYQLWRLGQAIERADMTTRLIGMRAAALLATASASRRGDPVNLDDDHDEVQWMGILRSVAGMQMYQRVTSGPIDGLGVIGFLVTEERFPASVAGSLDTIRRGLARLPRPQATEADLVRLVEMIKAVPKDSADGAGLDAAMDSIQLALAALSNSILTGVVHPR